MNFDDINFNNDVVLVDKPAGWTSFDVVAKVRGELSRRYLKQHGQKKRIKVGHSGTLDPAATGLLVLAIGKATKRIESMTKLDKVYEVEATLGQTITTGDSEGEIIASKRGDFSFFEKDKKAELKEVLQKFVGQISQIPPKYSAIKVDGKRAYKLAREGKEFELEPRQVRIYWIENVSYETPVLKFTCKVSSGTYIRSLVEDIGEELGVGAYMSGLRRTKVGDFDLSDAHSLEVPSESAD